MMDGSITYEGDYCLHFYLTYQFDDWTYHNVVFNMIKSVSAASPCIYHKKTDDVVILLCRQISMGINQNRRLQKSLLYLTYVIHLLEQFEHMRLTSGQTSSTPDSHLWSVIIELDLNLLSSWPLNTLLDPSATNRYIECFRPIYQLMSTYDAILQKLHGTVICDLRLLDLQFLKRFATVFDNYAKQLYQLRKELKSNQKILMSIKGGLNFQCKIHTFP